MAITKVQQQPGRLRAARKACQPAGWLLQQLRPLELEALAASAGPTAEQLQDPADARRLKAFADSGLGKA